MSNRERWVIYPLLFLALGFALKPKFVPPEKFKCRLIECDELIVGRNLVAVGKFQAARIDTGVLHVSRSAQIDQSLTVRSIKSTTAISSVTQTKTLDIVGDDGKRRLSMGTPVRKVPQGTAADEKTTTVDTGRIEIYDKDQNRILVLGSTADGKSGLVLAANSNGQEHAVLRASPDGGQLVLYDASGQVHIFAGHLPPKSGVFVSRPNGSSSRVDWLYEFDRSQLPKPQKPKVTKPDVAKPSDKPPENTN